MPNNVEAPNTLISNQRIKIVDVVSEGTTYLFTPVSGVSGYNPLCSVYFDDIPVMNGDGSPNYNISGQGFRFTYTSGASGQSPMVGFEKVEALIPLPVNTRVYSPPAGQGYPQAPVATFNTSQYPDAEGVKVTTRVPAMFTVDTKNGNTNAFSLFYEMDISTNGGPWEVQFPVGNTDGNGDPSTVVEVRGKCTSPYYRTHILPLPKEVTAQSFYEWKVRVRRISENILSSNTANDLFVDSVAVVSSNTYSYPRTALVGLEISADQFGNLPTRAYDVKGIQVLVPNGYTPTQYNTDGTITAAVYPGIWTGLLTTRAWTDNPAWIFYDLCTNKRYGLGNYIRTDWMDKWTLYQIAQYCDEMVDDGAGGLEPRFTCNVSIQQAQDAYTLLNNLVSVFRGMLYWADGRVSPVGGETRDPVFNFSNSNVIGGAFNYSDTPRTTRSTVCVIRWNDPANLFRSTPERIEDPNARAKYGVIEKQITAFATTSRGQAVRAANWILTAEQQLTETIQFQTDLEGVYLRPGDVVNVYDNYRNNQSQGGRLTDFSPARDTLVLDKPVKLSPGFTYFMAAIVPAATLSVTGVTGSNQIGSIRNSQIETRQVSTSPGTGLTILNVYSPFSSALYKGSVWVLSASGSSITVFDAATQYKVLGTSEVGPGQIEVLGVKYQTGINYLVNNNYSIETNPPIVGDTTPPLPPTGLRGQRVTGLLNDNTFFSYAYVYWTGSSSVNTSYYDVSGRLAANPWFGVGQATTTGIQYTPDTPGTYTFRVGAFNANGYGSAYNEGTYIEPSTNPFGVTAPLSGIYIRDNYDPYTLSPTLGRYTGFVGTTPLFSWNISDDPTDTDLEVPSAQYISGYKIQMYPVTGGIWNLMLGGPVINTGKENNVFAIPDQFLYTGVSIKPLRAFKLAVDTLDYFGNTQPGATLTVYNNQPRAPIGSGFVGYNGGVSYNVQPARLADVSGLYLWTNASLPFTPTYDNATLRTENLAGDVTGPSAGNVFTWYSVLDSYGYSGSTSVGGDNNAPIYGPISGNTSAIIGNLFNIWNPAITGTYALVTGLTYTVATGDGASATSILGLIAAVSGTYSKVQIVANAFVTGNLPGGTNNAAVATYGFQLDANGKVVSMVATSSSFPGSQSTITFGGARLQSSTYSALSAGWSINEDGSVDFNNITGRGTLQSSTFTPGSAGWRIQAGGNAEFNSISARGAFTGGAGSAMVTMDSRGLAVGNPAGYRALINAGAPEFYSYSAANHLCFDGGITNVAGTDYGRIQLYKDADSSPYFNADASSNGTLQLGGGTITLVGSAGSINCDTLDVDTTSNFDGTATFNASTAINCGGNSIAVGGGNGNNAGITYNGGNKISFSWNGSNVKVYVDGSVQGTIPNP